jgi:predicted DNA binding protein
LLFLRASTSDAEGIVDVALSVESVTNCRVISETDDSCYVEVTKTESVADAMMGVGATVTHASADRGTGTLVVEAPPTVNADNVVTAYTEQNPDSRFVAKRSIDQAIEMPHIVTGQLSEELTEKQCIALEAAYYGGYFDWPRGSTAEEIAMSLGVSSATFQEHLRVALDKLVELNLDNFDY